MTDIKTDNIRVVVNRVDDFYSSDDLRRSAQREPDMYVFDEETGELLLITCLAMGDTGQVHLVDKGEDLELAMGYDHKHGPYEPGYIPIDDIDEAIALLQAAKQKLTDSPKKGA